MKLINKELEEKFPKLYETENQPADSTKIVAKFFCPWTSASWFAVEYDPIERICFGYVNLGDDTNAELGCFAIEELEDLRGPMGLKIERDLYFGNHSLKEVIEAKGRL